MTLRVRIAAGAAGAVALAVLAAAITVYVAVRSDLRGQIDQSLSQRAQGLLAVSAPVGPGGPGGPGPGGPGGFGGPAPGGAGAAGAASAPGQPPRGGSDFDHRFPRQLAPVRFGGASGYVQFLSQQGALLVPGGQGSSPAIPASARDRAIARAGGRALSDRTVKGTHLRVLTVVTPGFGALLIARPLTEVDHELRNILLILVIVGVVGIALAALLGALVARAALTPVVRFTRRAETLSGGIDLSQRLHVSGRDELARMAASFNATLDALERAVEAQRHLIADASHELRTPIASLRANVQILAEAQRLPPAEQEALRHDIIAELDELTALVSDVVELARGSRAGPVRDEVRVDEIVAAAAEHARRRGGPPIELSLEPTLVSGEGQRIARAVTNLLDNARKWSPAEGVVEVALRDGELTVRDHGPGFAEQDLAHVFERFYRAEHARKLPGSGLGLAIVRQAAEAHGGYARAENAPGGGALLRVSFGPALALDQPAPAPAALG